MFILLMYSNTSQTDRNLVFKSKNRLLQLKVLQNVPRGSTLLSAFIKLPFVIKNVVLSIYEWPFYTGFTVVYT